jgi:hypothetical protein
MLLPVARPAGQCRCPRRSGACPRPSSKPRGARHEPATATPVTPRNPPPSDRSPAVIPSRPPRSGRSLTVIPRRPPRSNRSLAVIPRRPQADEGSGRGPEPGRGATDTEQRDSSAPPLQRNRHRAACAWPAPACISTTFRPARSIISVLLASHRSPSNSGIASLAPFHGTFLPS